MSKAQVFKSRPGARIQGMDVLRGLLMVWMALDHASFFIGRSNTYLGGERWGGGFPRYDDAGLFFLRFITHFCAPGFLMLMAMGLPLFRASRLRAGWNEGRIFQHAAARGGVLIAAQFVLENPAWLIGTGFDYFPVHFGVLAMLGACLIIGAALQRLPSQVLLLLAVVLAVWTSALFPHPSQWQEPFNDLTRIFFVPGTGEWVRVFYSLFPWLCILSFALGFGKMFLEDEGGAADRRLLWIGLGLVAVFPALRFAGGVFANRQLVPIDTWWSWFYAVKYPPSLSFLCLTIGVNLLLLYAFRRWERGAFGALVSPLTVFGRSAFFFYAAHLYLYAVLGLLVPEELRQVPAVVLGWLVGLGILFPIAKRYGDFKQSQPANSFWRLL